MGSQFSEISQWSPPELHWRKDGLKNKNDYVQFNILHLLHRVFKTSKIFIEIQHACEYYMLESLLITSERAKALWIKSLS